MSEMKSPVTETLQNASNPKKENHFLKKRPQCLEEKNCRYWCLFDTAADAIFLGDSQGKIREANQSASELTGYSQAELIGIDLGELFSSTERQRAPLRFDLVDTGQRVLTERMLTRRDGSTVAVQMNSAIMPDGTYHSFMRDISVSKQVEDALRSSEEKFFRAFNLNPDAININRLHDGVYIAVNQGFKEITGWTEEEIIGRSSLPDGINIWHDKADRERLLTELQANGYVTQFEARFRGKSGRTIHARMSARVIELNGESCILNISRDISAEIEAQKKQKKLEEQMLQAQKLESLGVLAGGIAHDFNNILMAVIGHCELAQRRVAKDSPARPNFEQIKLAAAKAADLANQMLAYSGKGKFNVKPLNLNVLILEMEKMLGVSISKKAVISFDLHDSLPTIEADPTQMRQVIMNLVINASEAIGPKNGVISITTGTQFCDNNYLSETWLDENLPAGHYVFMEIADNGCGISQKDISRIFEPFYSTKFSGRGLGMAAVLGIVRGHKGAIKVYSEPQMGSTFKVLVPASELVAEQVAAVEQPITIDATGQVLLVDDEESLRSIGKAMLEELGFDVLTAADGFEALASYQQQRQDIRFVLMDLTMPHMDGEEAFRELRRIDPTVQVIICSGYNEIDVTQRFAGKGLAGFLKKPYQLQGLQKVVSKMTNHCN